jgi:hypothetical protein
MKYPVKYKIPDDLSIRVETAYLIANKLVAECILKPEEVNDFTEKMIKDFSTAKEMVQYVSGIKEKGFIQYIDQPVEIIDKQKVIENYGIDVQKLNNYSVNELYQAVVELEV